VLQEVMLEPVSVPLPEEIKREELFANTPDIVNTKTCINKMCLQCVSFKFLKL
jgi:hypothetical protein